MTEQPLLSPLSAVIEKIPHIYQCNYTDNRTELWWQPDTVINRFHKENVRLCLKQLSLKTLVSLRAQQALPWNLWDVKLLKASVRTGVATVRDFTRVTDDPMTAGYIILGITHMTSFKGTSKKVTLERAHQLYCCGTMKTSPLEILYDTRPSFAAAKSNSINWQMLH